MRALLLILIASTALGQGRFERFNSRCGQGRSSRGFKCASGVSLADAPQAGDLSGAWWAMYGDGTMRSGSAVTLVPTNVPVNTVENGWPVRTYNLASNDQEPANSAFPASDFSVCKHVRLPSYSNCQLGSFANTGAVADAATLPLELQVGGTLWMYVSDGAFYSNFPSATVLGTDPQWRVICATYQRVGGALNNVGALYVDGVQVATSSTQRLAQGIVSKWTTNGYAGGSTGCNHSTRGGFVTYKLLSPTDIARIYAATAP